MAAGQFLEPQLHVPLYTFAEADRIAGVTRGTARRWLTGYAYRRPDGQLVAKPPVDRARQTADAQGVTFLDLIELVVIGHFKDHGFRLPEIRRVVDECRRQFEDPHPLTSQRFKVGGRDVFVQRGTALFDVLHRRGQAAWDEILDPFLETLDYREGVAVRWWPLGRQKPVVVDPEFGFGLPVIEGSGVRTETIRERFEAGDSWPQIASDFNVQMEDIESAVQFELQRAA